MTETGKKPIRGASGGVKHLVVVTVLVVVSYLVAGWLSEEFVSLLSASNTAMTGIISERPEFFVRLFRLLFFSISIWLYFDELKRVPRILFPDRHPA